MATIPFALSISHLVSSAGADVGFAAILGLAVMVLLFFSQARETATLRRRADEAEDQLRRLAAYVEQVARRPAGQPTQAGGSGLGSGTVAPVPPPAAARVAARQSAFPAASRPAPASAPAAAAMGAVATIPAAPAGVGAPALSSATRLIPLAEPSGTGSISVRSLKNGDGHDGESALVDAAAPPLDTVAAPAGPPPSTAAAGANGSSRPATPPPSPAADVPPPRAPQRREGAAAGRPVGPPTFNDPVPPSRTRVNRVVLVAASVVAVIVVIVAVLVLTNRGGSGAPAQSASSSAAAKSSASARHARHHAAATVTPSSVNVAVLNGTSTTHLAADVMAKLTSAGYKPGATTNAPEQNVTSTIVGYTASSYKPDALAVAKSLNLGPASVQGVSQGDRAAACHGATTSCPSQVVVTLGSDLASAASSSTATQ